MITNEISGEVVDSSLKVHTALGAGLLESPYEACLAHELRKRGLKVLSQVPMPIQYDDVRIDIGYRVDLLVEGLVIAELKAVAKLTPLHEAQLRPQTDRSAGQRRTVSTGSPCDSICRMTIS